MTPREFTTIEHLKTMGENHQHLNYSDIKNAVGHLVPNLPISTGSHAKLYRPKEDGFQRDTTLVFRARVNEILSKGSTMVMPFQNIKDISIVPTEKRQHIATGRCNLKKEAIFYCSNYPPTACIESASQGFTKDFRNMTVTLGAWKIINPLNLAEMGFSANTLKELEQQTNVCYDHLHNINQQWYENIKFQIETLKQAPHSSEFDLAVLEYFSDQFGKTRIDSEVDYYLSNVYSDVILNHSAADENGTLYDGILYPSVRNALEEFNLALHPRALPKLKFISAEQIWITKGDDNKINFNSLESAFADDQGNLKWNQFNVKEQDIINIV